MYVRYGMIYRQKQSFDEIILNISTLAQLWPPLHITINCPPLPFPSLSLLYLPIQAISILRHQAHPSLKPPFSHPPPFPRPSQKKSQHPPTTSQTDDSQEYHEPNVCLSLLYSPEQARPIKPQTVLETSRPTDRPTAQISATPHQSIYITAPNDASRIGEVNREADVGLRMMRY